MIQHADFKLHNMFFEAFFDLFHTGGEKESEDGLTSHLLTPTLDGRETRRSVQKVYSRRKRPRTVI